MAKKHRCRRKAFKHEAKFNFPPLIPFGCTHQFLSLATSSRMPYSKQKSPPSSPSLSPFVSSTNSSNFSLAGPNTNYEDWLTPAKHSVSHGYTYAQAAWQLQVNAGTLCS
jgi:hypothetical protein